MWCPLQAVQSFSSDAFGSTIGCTIFDETLPFFLRYLRSSIISTLTAFSIYCVLQMGYDPCIIPAVLILRQDPAQWTPPFEHPWFATSVSDFWGRRWHQFYRRTFIFLGIYPLSLVFGRMGGIFGAFFAFAVFHHIIIITLDGQMVALAHIGERVFRQWTGRKVGRLWVGCGRWRG
ncbi:hypothetical protein PAXINDRAFT_103729 [Paxillus involutus ATCC 200175]|uniref:Wax synthase domain-containing protein n=1 Tax=Paxillus involutus ATCC 200175 TaxID=664439 RepID=A0A0C9TBH5_PAXIN|nr:hypothetical protein PAXINDRAFT_103729 [Paxillus involutus ATCC 200175]